MRPQQRTWLGITCAILLAPLIIGLAACLPVPIGDPERSRLDSDMTGVWLEVDGEPFVTMFEPYDRRTWLVTTAGMESRENCAPPVVPAGYDELVEWLEAESCAGADRAAIYKAWRSKHGGYWFLTMEPMALLSDESDDPFAEGAWFVYRIRKIGADSFELHLVNPDFEGFDGLPEKPRAYEKIIRKNVDNKDLYVEPISQFKRVKAEHIGLLADFIDDVIDVEL